MKKIALRIQVLGAICLSLTWIFPVQAKPLPWIDQMAQGEMDRQKWVGLALGVVEKGEITYLQTYGYANRAKKEAVTQNSLFRWASVAKPVTAVLALQWMEAGKLNLDQPIQSYDPDFENPQGWPLTLRQLLNHQSGYGHYEDISDWQSGVKRYYDLPPKDPANPRLQFSALRAFETIFKPSPLLFRPGTAYHYSSFGYILAGAVLEKVAQLPYTQQFENQIQEPLGLTTMQADYQAQYLPYRVTGYYLERGLPKERADDDVSWKLPAGGFISNIGDMSRFMQGLMGTQLLAKSSKTMLWSPQTTITGEKINYGLGFSLDDNQPQGLRVEHFGGQTKTRTLMSFYPQRQTGIVLMTNSEWADLAPLRDQLFKHLLK